MSVLSSRPGKRPRQPVACPSIWTAFFAGILLGILLSLFVYVQLIQPHTGPANGPVATVSSAVPVSSQAAPTPVSESDSVTAQDASEAAQPAKPVAEQENVATATPPSEEPEAEESPRPRFEFYDVLQHNTPPAPLPEEPVPAAEVVAPALPSFPVALEPGETPPVGAEAGYAVQVASLRRQEDAQQLKAKLALRGFQASIQTAWVNGQQWFRVRIGPYAERSAANQVRALLQQDRIDSIVVKY